MLFISFIFLWLFDLVCVLWVGIKFKWVLLDLKEEDHQNCKTENIKIIIIIIIIREGRRRPPVWVCAREIGKKKEEEDHHCGFVQERGKKKVMQEREEKVVYVLSASVGPTIFNIFTTMPPSIVTQKLKTAREVYTVFKHHKLRTMTQTPLVKHSYQTLFFLKSRCKNIKELGKTTNLRWNEEL